MWCVSSGVSLQSHGSGFKISLKIHLTKSSAESKVCIWLQNRSMCPAGSDRVHIHHISHKIHYTTHSLHPTLRQSLLHPITHPTASSAHILLQTSPVFRIQRLPCVGSALAGNTDTIKLNLLAGHWGIWLRQLCKTLVYHGGGGSSTWPHLCPQQA